MTSSLYKVRKKPVEVAAMHLSIDNGNDVCDWIEDNSPNPVWLHNDGTIMIQTMEGTMQADIDDWIIRGVKGEFYPCKPDIFDETYEILV